jgi:hypothetical protein
MGVVVMCAGQGRRDCWKDVSWKAMGRGVLLTKAGQPRQSQSRQSILRISIGLTIGDVWGFLLGLKGICLVSMKVEVADHSRQAASCMAGFS